MSDVAAPAPAPAQAQPVSGTSLRRLLGATEIDMRLFGMLIALIAILVGFHILSGGRFLQPANLITLSVQASGVAIMATGMVLIIVSRNIDLSVGSIVGVTAMAYALLQTDWLPALGLGADSGFLWLVALAAGLGLGAFIGGVQGFIIAYIGVPSFIVTLGGLLSLRGSVWLLSSGAAVSGLQTEFKKIGGGPQGSIGGTITWILAVLASAGIIALIVYNRRQRQRFGFPLRPMWAEVLLAVVGCAIVLGVAAFANANFMPPNLAPAVCDRQRDHRAAGRPEGSARPAVAAHHRDLRDAGDDLPGHAPSFRPVRLRLRRQPGRGRPGRHQHALDDHEDLHPDGHPVRHRRQPIGAARLNGATLDVGQSDELYVIAAAVVGGTSFAGGIGTIPGAVLGAFVMQSLAYGMSFNGINSPTQNVVAGIVLIVAVGFDTWNRRRSGGS